VTSPAPNLLSPSRAWRLTECPASGQAAGLRPNRGLRESNAGTLAHKAIEQWIIEDGYRAHDAKTSLSRSLDAALAAAGGVAPPSWTYVRSRLRARALELVAAIGGGLAGVVVPEKRLTDLELGIEGTPDIVVVGDAITLIDLKTEELDGSDLSPWVLFQLRIYAHLIQESYGSLPSRVEVFSANRGRLPVPMSPADVQSALTALAASRRAHSSLAMPAPETCRFCQRRLVCLPHWDAVSRWPQRDCVEGRLQSTERADNGLMAARLKTTSDFVLVSEIPAVRLSAPIGSWLRFVRVNPRRADDAMSGNWRWGRLSDVGVI